MFIIHNVLLKGVDQTQILRTNFKEIKYPTLAVVYNYRTVENMLSAFDSLKGNNTVGWIIIYIHTYMYVYTSVHRKRQAHNTEKERERDEDRETPRADLKYFKPFLRP